MADPKRLLLQTFIVISFVATIVSVVEGRTEKQEEFYRIDETLRQQERKMVRRSTIELSRLAGNDQREEANRVKRAATITHTGTSQSDIIQFVDTHNSIRTAVNPPATNMLYISWSADAAAIAQAHADKCVFEHNSQKGNLGENIYASTGDYSSTSTAKNALIRWRDEVGDYTYSSDTCASGKVCGHYTQVVWATSAKIGCGITTCQPLTLSGGQTYATGTFVVCNYDPPGNFQGQKPYKTGTACSECPSGMHCENNLCTTATATCTKQCLNGGTLNSATCQCDCTGTSFTGDTCQTSSGSGTGNACSGKQCLNGGIFNTATCQCDCTGTGYKGDTCQDADNGVSGVFRRFAIMLGLVFGLWSVLLGWSFSSQT